VLSHYKSHQAATHQLAKYLISMIKFMWQKKLSIMSHEPDYIKALPYDIQVECLLYLNILDLANLHDVDQYYQHLLNDLRVLQFLSKKHGLRSNSKSFYKLVVDVLLLYMPSKIYQLYQAYNTPKSNLINYFNDVRVLAKSMSTVTGVIKGFSDYDELLKKIQEATWVEIYKLTDSGNHEKIDAYPTDMVTYIQDEVDPAYNQRICVYTVACFNSVLLRTYISITIRFLHFHYDFEKASGDEELWMMIYIANKLGLLSYNTKLSQYKADLLKELIMTEFERRKGRALSEGDQFLI
jgi:hypothetical protein